MLNSAKIIPAVHRKFAISDKMREGVGEGGSPGSATDYVRLPVLASTVQLCNLLLKFLV